MRLSGPLPAEEAEQVELRSPRLDLEAWRREPLARPVGDPRFEIHRFTPDRFDRVYDLVDEAFGVRRPRALYDWLYRENPQGPARCWVFTDRAGTLVSVRTNFPWPAAVGAQRAEGWLGGDMVTAPAWQRTRVRDEMAETVNAQAVLHEAIHLSWPNEKSITRLTRRGWGHRILGPVPRLALSLSGGPSSLAAALRRLRSLVRPTASVEPVTRFDGSFDRATRLGMAWRGAWSPHGADFLNWRYLDHPTREYHARAVLAGDRPAGYCVVSVDGDRANLMELVAEASDDASRAALVDAAVGLARDAGCRRLAALCTPGWRHEAFLRRAGFVDARSRTYLMASLGAPDWCCNLDVWQLSGGDHDAW